ncbi:MAG: FAD-dependent oxidoreductase [Pseudomonadota bacterium]
MSNSRLLLIGGGHSHVAVLADWIRHGAPGRATLITPSPTLRYSGMVPGWIAGEHDRDDGLVDLAGLAQRAGIDLLLDRCIGIDGDASRISTDEHGKIDFDIASVDIGGIGRAQSILGNDPRIIDVRPIDAFVDRFERWREANSDERARIAVVGGGAGGVELAFGFRNASGFEHQPNVAIVTGQDGLLPGFSAGVRNRVVAEFERQGIETIGGNAALANGALSVADTSLEPVDLIVTALGSAAPLTGDAVSLDRDQHGFIAVDRFQRSASHPHIFAAGDVASRQDRHVPHSGVHAVHAGPILAANLRALANGREPVRTYEPRPASLYLLSTGNGSAIASYGRMAGAGRWAARFKRWIDKRWIGTYARLASGS